MEEGFMDLLPDYDPTDGEMRRVSLNEAMTHRLRNCAECGEVFACYPEIHGWRMGNKLFCSYHCMRIAERRAGLKDKAAIKKRLDVVHEKELAEAELRIRECEKKIVEYGERLAEADRPGRKRQAAKALNGWKKKLKTEQEQYAKLIEQ